MLHIQKFVDRVQSLEARQQKDYIMSMVEAKALHADITRLLLQLNDLSNRAQNEEVVTLQVSGGKF